MNILSSWESPNFCPSHTPPKPPAVPAASLKISIPINFTLSKVVSNLPILGSSVEYCCMLIYLSIKKWLTPRSLREFNFKYSKKHRTSMSSMLYFSYKLILYSIYPSIFFRPHYSSALFA